LAFRWKDRLFSGDHVMDWSSSLVSPPDGSLGDFMATSQRLGALDVSTFHPAHGGALTDPSGRLEWLISHRSRRETEILDALGSGSRSIQRLTAQVYRELDPAMLPAAERNVLAHLIDLVEKGTVIAEPELGQNAKYKLA
jgi:hydroxyacylglutathione hydrolase